MFHCQLFQHQIRLARLLACVMPGSATMIAGGGFSLSQAQLVSPSLGDEPWDDGALLRIDPVTQ